MKHKIPRFLIPLFNECETDDERKELLKKLELYKDDKITKAIKNYLEKTSKELDLEDEKVFSTWFETKYRRAQRIGRKKQIRHIINDLS